MAINEATDDNFNALVNSGKPTLIYFTATWCAPCRQTGPIIDDLAREHPNVNVVKVDIDKARQSAQAYLVKQAPTLVFLDANGRPKSRLMGGQPKVVIANELKHYI